MTDEKYVKFKFQCPLMKFSWNSVCKYVHSLWTLWIIGGFFQATREQLGGCNRGYMAIRAIRGRWLVLDSQLQCCPPPEPPYDPGALLQLDSSHKNAFPRTTHVYVSTHVCTDAAHGTPTCTRTRTPGDCRFCYITVVDHLSKEHIPPFPNGKLAGPRI